MFVHQQQIFLLTDRFRAPKEKVITKDRQWVNKKIKCFSNKNQITAEMDCEDTIIVFSKKKTDVKYFGNILVFLF